jgi:tetratricopeptide (TPR) repeat protein
LIADDDAYAAYNRYVLAPETGDPDVVKDTLPSALAQLVDVLRFSNGELDAAPDLDHASDAVVAALVLAARATELFTRARASDCISLLHEASDRVADASPPLAAILRGNAGTVAYEQGLDLDSAQADLLAAVNALADTDLAISRAELHYQLGGIEHELAAAGGASLQAAMHHYYTALQLVTHESAPFLWASTQMNMSTAYPSAAMTEASDQLRMGIAIQGLRSALEVFTRDEHTAQWATATLNLANALVYTPSVKQGDNLVEAVELYEKVLEVRDRDSDPAGRARVLTNQGNALAHLGIFDQAKAKLVEARYLFEEQLDHDGVLTVRGVLDEIVKRTTPEGGRDGVGRLAMAGVDELRTNGDDPTKEA